MTAGGVYRALAAPGDLILEDGRVALGPHHAVPPCRHFPQCGGCQLQHLDDETYAQFIVDRIVGALREQRLDLPVIEPVHLSPPRTRRRTSLRAERRGRQVAVGFNEGASHRIVDMRECHVLLPELFALVAPLRTLLAAVLPDRARATIAMTQADQGVDLLLSGFELSGLAGTEALTAFAERQQLARLALDEGFGPQARYSPQPVTVTLSGVAVPLPDNGFLQATADGEAILVEAVLGSVGEVRRSVDLFAGLGTFALALPGTVTAYEGARDAALSLKTAAQGIGRAVHVEHSDLFRRPVTAAELGSVEAAVLDPPRAGAAAQVGALAGSSVARIAYVSCNPATFARDARTLVDGGYRLVSIKPVGQFRWSTHVELVARFER